MRTNVDAETLTGKARAVAAALSAGLGKVDGRFVADMVVGILRSDSVRLTRIAAALGEPIPLHATHKRLSRNLGKARIGEIVGANLLAAGARLIGAEALLILDVSDLAKPYARKMEHARGGYRVCDVLGWDFGGGPMADFARLATSLESGSSPAPDEAPRVSAWNDLIATPLARAVWSPQAPDCRGDAGEVLALAGRVVDACCGRGVLAFDATTPIGLPEAVALEGGSRFIARVGEGFALLHRRRPHLAGDVAAACDTPYGTTIYKRRQTYDEGMFIHFGFAPVRLAERPELPLWLIVVKGLTSAASDWNPLLMLTNEPMRRSRSVLWRPIWSFLHYWDAQRANQSLRRQFDFDDVRVLSYGRLRNVATLVQAAAFVEAQWPGLPVDESLFLRPRQDKPLRYRGS